MSDKAYSPRSPCPIAAVLDVLGDRWTLLIIRDMMFRGFHEYGEFLTAGEGISTNILAERLKRLVEFGIIVRNENPSDRKRVIYTLSEKGIDLMPAMLDMVEWGNKYFTHCEIPEEYERAIQTDKAGTILNLRKHLLTELQQIQHRK